MLGTTDLAIAPADGLEILQRLALALVTGAIVGLERELAGKSAGLRTHMLVGLGSALFVLVPLLGSYPEVASETLGRAVQGIATGVGFLGAGEILRKNGRHDKMKVKGLTSAAAIWVSAALGVASGCGLWQLALSGLVLTLLVLRLSAVEQ